MKITLLGLLSCVVAADKLQIGVLKKPVECDVKARPGDKVAVHYRGKLTDGTQFDSSYNRNSPIEFTLGANQVIPGWEQGIQGMCVGEARRLTIPPELGYGDRGAGGVIPPGATLIFDTELVGLNGEHQNHDDL